MAREAKATRRTGTPSRQVGRTRWACTAVMLAAASVLGRPAMAADSAQIQKAIDGGRNYLFSHQKDGNWEITQTRDATKTSGASVDNVQWGGLTALATLALLASGVDSKDPHIQQAVAFLRKVELRGHYALGLRAQVWGLLPPEPWIKQAQQADLQQLEKAILLGKSAGPATGIYGYAVGRSVEEADHSVSQFAVLGVWALAQSGQEVPTSYWQVVDTAWHQHQLASGAWGYRVAFPAKPVPPKPGTVVDPRKPPPKVEPVIIPATLSMSAAGVATLFITQEFMQIAPRCAGNIDDAGIEAGMKYLGDHLKEGFSYGRDYYTLFGISRVGLASGYKYLGKTDWFKWGSDIACRGQSTSGGWTGFMEYENMNGVPDTSFALLFLARGRAPVMMNKLRYDMAAGPGKGAKPVPAAWDQRPRDVANLSRWVGHQIESQLNWQVVSLDQSANDLHDAPILYMAGAKAPKLSDADVAKLRAYCEDGGLLLGHADCASAEFSKGFRALGERMFPDHKFRALEANSPILANEQYAAAQWKLGKPAIEALSNGAREMLVLLPTGDPGRTWQSQSLQSSKKEIYGALMADLFQYAVDKEGLRRRGETYMVERNETATAAPVGKGKKAAAAEAPPVRVARLKYDGNWDPEPGGWRRLSNVMHNAGVAELSTEAVAGPIDKSFPLASLTIAASDAKLTDAARSAIRDYVKGGGTLLVDVAGGRSLYRAAAEAELAKIFPDAPRDLPVLPPTDAVFAAAGKALSAASVEYRRFDRPAGAPRVPQLRGWTTDGRVAVYYSREDVSVGLVGMRIDGVAGYTPDDATKVVADVVAAAAKKR